MSQQNLQAGNAGGISGPFPIDEETKKLALRFKAAAEHQLGREFPIYNPLTYSTQVVAGINFFIAVAVTPVGWGTVQLQIFENLNKEFHFINAHYIFHHGQAPPVAPSSGGQVPTGPGPVVPPHIPTGTGPVVFPTPWAEVTKQVTHFTDSLKEQIETKLGRTLKVFVPVQYSTLTTFHDTRYTVIVESGVFTYYLHDVPQYFKNYIEVVFSEGHPVSAKPHLISAQDLVGPLPPIGSKPPN